MLWELISSAHTEETGNTPDRSPVNRDTHASLSHRGEILASTETCMFLDRIRKPTDTLGEFCKLHSGRPETSLQCGNSPSTVSLGAHFINRKMSALLLCVLSLISWLSVSVNYFRLAKHSTDVQAEASVRDWATPNAAQRFEVFPAASVEIYVE